ncbi:MAG: Tol-Pal system beta propeller repeat protein TolB [Paracoccaceae bacterium]
MTITATPLPCAARRSSRGPDARPSSRAGWSRRHVLAALGAGAGLGVAAGRGWAQDGPPLRIDVTGANFEPIPIAIETFETEPGAPQARAAEIAEVVRADLERSGLFRTIPEAAFPAEPTGFDDVPDFADWAATGAQALVRGRLAASGDGRLRLQFRVFDLTAGEQLEGLQLLADPMDWRRLGHRVADGAYTALTGEGAYFDSRVVFVDERGPKDARIKRLAVMDQDGANLRTVETPSDLVLTPRFSPNEQAFLYIGYDAGVPQVYLQSLDTGRRERLGFFEGMAFAPRFSPDGRTVVLSQVEGGNTDLYAMRLADRSLRRLTSGPSIDTAPSFSPDGAEIVFESDRGGSQQLYVMPAEGGEARRISFGEGRYGTPVWSPKGDRIAFTKMLGGRFHIGVMRPDGSDERLLTTSYLDEGPTWSPNGRVLMFFREGAGEGGRPQLMSIDISGRNLKRVPTPNGASDPAWSPLRS